MKIERAIELVQRFQRDTQNIVDNTIRLQWKHGFMLASFRKHVSATDDFKRMPRWAKGEVKGYFEALLQQAWRKVVFSNITPDGTRQAIDSEAYRAVSPQVISELYSETGCYIWREEPHERFTDPNQEA